MSMKLKGTKFQIQVWEEIKKIPKGSIKTYKEIACILGKPNSSRAVANACAKIHSLLKYHVIESLDLTVFWVAIVVKVVLKRKDNF